MAEKTAQEITRVLREYFAKGKEALQRENYDYAINIFNQILTQEPAFYDCREHLRVAQHKKAGKGGGFLKKMFSSASASPLLAKGQIALRTKPVEAIAIAEQILNTDPASGPAHRMLAEAALAANLPRTAILSLEIVNKNSPGDKALRIHLAKAHAQAGDSTRAEAVYSELLREFPNDPDVSQLLKNVSASKTMAEGGFEAVNKNEGSFRDLLRDKEQANVLEKEQRQFKSEDDAQRLIQEYETRRKTEPKNLRLARSLAELYTQKKAFDKALELYEFIRTEGGNDSSLDRVMAETQIRKYEYLMSLLDPKSPDYAAEVERIKAEKQAYQLAECKGRVERYPTDLSIRFEMGQLYFETGKISEAIQELQKAQGNPHKRTAALNYLAQCFAKRKIFDLAASTLQDAIKEKPVFDEEKKELTYNLGCVLETMGKKEDAIEQFKLIYKVDTSYKDVAAKVDAHYGGK